MNVGDIRRASTAALGAAATALEDAANGAFAKAVTGWSEDVVTPVATGWSGSAAEAAKARLSTISSALGDMSALLPVAARAATDLADAITAAKATITAAEAEAGAAGLVLADDGSVGPPYTVMVNEAEAHRMAAVEQVVADHARHAVAVCTDADQIAARAFRELAQLAAEAVAPLTVYGPSLSPAYQASQLTGVGSLLKGIDPPPAPSYLPSACGPLPPGVSGPTISCRAYLAGVTVSSPALRNVLGQLYRPGATVGDGGSAAMLRAEVDNPSWNGSFVGTHYQKVGDYINRLNRLLRRQGSDSLDESDREVATNLRNDLQNARTYAEQRQEVVQGQSPPEEPPPETPPPAEPPPEGPPPDAPSGDAAGATGEGESVLGEAEQLLEDLGELG